MADNAINVMGHRLAGDNLQERADRIRRIEFARMRMQVKADREGKSIVEIEQENSKELILTDDDLASAGMYDLNGVVYSSREKRDAVKAALEAAGIEHHYPGAPEARRVLRDAGIND